MALPPNLTTMVLPWNRWMYGSASPRMRAFSAACGEVEVEVRGAFMAPPDTTEKLLDGDLLARRGGFLGQPELEHAVAELRFRFGLVDLLRQGEAARDLAVDALAMQHALVLVGFLLALHFGRESHLGAVDRHLDVLLAHAGEVGVDRVRAV